MKDHEQLALFHRALGELCRGGMPLGKAFRAVAEDLRSGRLREAADGMAAEVEAGDSLADAYRRREGLFPPVYAALVEAGIASGDLPGSLEEIARHAALRAEAAARTRRALAYPAVMALGLMVLSWFLFHFVVPRFAEIFASVEVGSGRTLELPGVTRAALALADLGILFVPVLLAAWVAAGYLRPPVDGLRMRVGTGMRLPVIGPLRLQASLLAFTAALEGLLRRGLPADRALDLAGAAAGSEDVRRAAAGMADRVRGGEGLADAASGAGILPPSLLWLVGSAERRGEAAEGLAEVGRVLGGRLRWRFERTLWLLVPAFELGVGLMVLLVVLAVFVPIFSLQSALM